MVQLMPWFCHVIALSLRRFAVFVVLALTVLPCCRLAVLSSCIFLSSTVLPCHGRISLPHRLIESASCRFIVLSVHLVIVPSSCLIDLSLHCIPSFVVLLSHVIFCRIFLLWYLPLMVSFYRVVPGRRGWGYHTDRAMPRAPAPVHTEAQPQDSSGERRKLRFRQLQGAASRLGLSGQSISVRPFGWGGGMGASSTLEWLLE